MRGTQLRWLMAPLLAASSLGASGADTRLVEATKKADIAAVRALLKQGADVNAPQGDGVTALHWAAHWDDAEAVDLLIRAGAVVNATNDLGTTPLWVACTDGSPAVIERLLKAGADPNLGLPSGETPLMTASRAGNAEAVKRLLAHGAKTNAKEHSRGQTALMWAAAARRSTVVAALLQHGADVQARSYVRRREVGLVLNPPDGDRNSVIAIGGVTEVEQGGYTALLFAAQQGDVDSARFLLAAGADVNDTAPAGTSALVVASHSGHGALGAFLLEKGADPNAAGAGYAALHAAILRRDVDLVKALLTHGAKPDAPVMKATPTRRYGDYALGVPLVGATPFWLAARLVEPQIMRVLATYSADPLFVMSDGTTALMAALGGRIRGEPGLPPDPVEVERKMLDAVKLGIELGIDANAANKAGNTAVHLAAASGLDSVIQFLAVTGTTLDVKNAKGQTPLAMATTAGRESTAELLRKLGATK